jgi:hypothetical protein
MDKKPRDWWTWARDTSKQGKAASPRPSPLALAAACTRPALNVNVWLGRGGVGACAALGATVAHMWNLLFATLLQSKESEDPCVYYLVNYLVDAVLGCVLSLLLLWGFETLADKYEWRRLRTGDYGSLQDSAEVWKRWGAQLSLWIGIVTLVLSAPSVHCVGCCGAV